MEAGTKGILTLLTDFGEKDPYVGIMKGVVLNITPRVVFVDLTHQVSRQCVEEGALFLKSAWRYFPVGTVHLAVVDPGVGSARKALVVAADGHYFVAPDNGILDDVLALPSAQVFEVQGRKYTLANRSSTFHGRDIFAPVAGHLIGGVAANAFGPGVENPVRLPVIEPIEVNGKLIGRVTSIDIFGNVITNIPGDIARLWLLGGGRCTLEKGEVEGLCRAYSDVPMGDCLNLVGSTGFLEISVRGGAANEVLGGEVGGVVELSHSQKGCRF